MEPAKETTAEVTTEETTVEEQAEGTTETTEETVTQEQTEEQEAQEQFLLRGKIGEDELIYDLRKDEDKQRLIADAQKGQDYQRKANNLAEFEKTNKAKIDAYDQMVSNEPLMKLIAAQQFNVDPVLLVSNPQEPDPNLRETDPQLYWQQYAAFQTHKQTKDGFERYWQQMKVQTGAQQNAIGFNKIKLGKELTNTEAEALELFVRNNFKPNALGVYTDDQILAAYHAKFPTRDQLQTSIQLQKTIKKISTGSPQTVAPKKTGPAPEEKSSKAFLDKVKESVKLREERK